MFLIMHCFPYHFSSVDSLLPPTCDGYDEHFSWYGKQIFRSPNILVAPGKYMSQFPLWPHRDKRCGGGRLETYKQYVKTWCVPRMVRTWKRHRGPSAYTTSQSGFPYKAPGGLLEGKQQDNLPLTLCHTHPAPAVPLPPDSSWFCTTLHAVAPPQAPKGFPGNATVRPCNCGQ